MVTAGYCQNNRVNTISSSLLTYLHIIHFTYNKTGQGKKAKTATTNYRKHHNITTVTVTIEADFTKIRSQL